MTFQPTLKFAESSPGVEYAVASGEILPFPSNRFELITVAQAIHWIDRENFFTEALRVLKQGCLLAAYDNYFLGRISNESDFKKWYRETFLKRFPTPTRDRLPFATESDNPNELVLAHEERHENVISLTQQGLVDYLITITNVINMVEKGENSIEEVSDWMFKQTENFFMKKPSREFIFLAPIWYFKKYGER